MKLNQGQDVTLNGQVYRNIEPLGSGAIADAYAGNLSDTRVAIKLLHDRWKTGSEEEAKLRHEGKVLRVLNAAEDSAYTGLSDLWQRLRWAIATVERRTIVALLDEGLDDHNRPFIVQEYAPPRVEIKPVQKPEDEYRVLTIMHRVGKAMVCAHGAGFSLQDFDPQTKDNRIRVRETSDGRVAVVQLIDWNITGGVQPGEVAGDIFYFGGHLHHLLLGQHLNLGADGRPPRVLGAGLAAWSALSEGSRSILSRLLDREPLRRYRTAVEVVNDLSWLERGLEVSLFGANPDRLRDQAYEARWQRRFDRVYTVADLALQRLSANDPNRLTYETLRTQAREELDKDLWQPLANARVSLLAKHYGQAAANFDRELKRLDSGSEPARLARYLKLQAQIGQAMREAGIAEPSQTPEWELFDRAIQSLVQRDGASAERALQQAAANPVLKGIVAFDALRKQSISGQWHVRSRRTRGSEFDPDEDAPNWLKLEAETIGRLDAAIALLKQALELAPDEQAVQDDLDIYEKDLKRRQDLLPFYRAIEDALPAGRLEDVRTGLDEVDKRYLGQRRAGYLRGELANWERFLENKQRAKAFLQDGHYLKAHETLRIAEDARIGDPQVAELLRVAEVGLAVQRRAADEIEKARSGLAAGLSTAPATSLSSRVVAVRDLIDRTRDALQAVLLWQGRPIGEAQAQARLVTLAAIQTSYLCIFDTSTQNSLTEIESQMTTTETELIGPVRAEIERSWEALDFSAAFDLATSAIGLGDTSQRAEMENLQQKLRRCIASSEALAQAIAGASRAWTTNAATIAETFTAAQTALKHDVLENSAMPKSATRQAEQLEGAIRAYQNQVGDFERSDNVAFTVSVVVSETKGLLKSAEVLIRDLCVTDLGIRANEAEKNDRIDATHNLFMNLRRLVGALPPVQQASFDRVKEALETRAQKERERADLLQAMRRDLADAEDFLRRRDYDQVRKLVSDALARLTGGDAGPEADAIRRRAQGIRISLIEAQLDQAKGQIRPETTALEASSVIALLNDALTDLDSAATIPAGNGTTDVAGFRKRILELGRELVQLPAKPAVAWAAFQAGLDGIASRCGQPDAFRDSRNLLEQVVNQTQPFVTTCDTWLTLEADATQRRVAQRNLKLLKSRLDECDAAWLALRRWLADSRGAIAERLRTVLNDHQRRADAAFSREDFAEGFSQAQAGYELIHDTGWEEQVSGALAGLRQSVQKATRGQIASATESWRRLDFEAAQATVTKLWEAIRDADDLLEENDRKDLQQWRDRLTQCVKAEANLKMRSASEWERWRKKAAPAKDILQQIVSNLEQLAQGEVLPKYCRDEARQLYEAARVISAPPTLGEAQVTNTLPTDEMPWAPLTSLRDLIRELAPSALRRTRAEASLKQAEECAARAVPPNLAQPKRLFKDAETQFDADDHDPEAETLRQRIKNGQAALAAAEEIERHVEALSFPTAEDSVPDTLIVNLAEADDAFGRLAKRAPAWPMLKAWTQEREKDTFTRLGTYLDALLTRIEQIREADPLSAYNLVAQGQQLLVRPRWRQPLAEQVKRLDALYTDLTPFNQAREEFEKLKNTLERQSPPANEQQVREIKQSLGRIPLEKRRQHVALYSEGIEYIIQLDASCRREPNGQSSTEGYAHIVKSLLDGAEQVAHSKARLQDEWPWFAGWADVWQGKAQQRIGTLTDQLAGALRDKTENFTKKIAENPDQLTNLVWQARWVWEATVDGDSTQRQNLLSALDSATQKLPATVTQTAAVPYGAFAMALMDVGVDLSKAYPLNNPGLAGQAPTPDAGGMGAAPAVLSRYSKADVATKMAGRLETWRAQCAVRPEDVTLPAQREGTASYSTDLPDDSWLKAVTGALETLVSNKRVARDKEAGALDVMIDFLGGKMAQTTPDAPLGRLIAQRNRIGEATDLEGQIQDAARKRSASIRNAVVALLAVADKLASPTLGEADRDDLGKAIGSELTACAGAIFELKQARTDTAEALRKTYLVGEDDSSAQRLVTALKKAIEPIQSKSKEEGFRVWRAVFDATQDTHNTKHNTHAKSLPDYAALHRTAQDQIKNERRPIPKVALWVGGIALIALAVIAIWLATRPKEQPIQISSVTPDSVIQQSGDAILTVEGQNFAEGATVVWRGQTFTATLESPTRLTVRIAAERLVEPGKETIKVIIPGKGESGWPFVVNPQPTTTPTVPIPTPTPIPTATPTSTPTATSTATPTPVVGGLGCTLRLAGPEGARVTVKFPLTQVIINQGTTSVDTTWEKLKFDPVDNVDCVPDDKTLQEVAKRVYRLVPRDAQTPASIKPNTDNASLKQVLGTKLLNLTKAFTVDAVSADLQPGKLEYTLEYQTAADKWEPILGINLILEWGTIPAVQPSPTPLPATPTPRWTPTPAIPTISLVAPKDRFDPPADTQEFEWQASGPKPSGTCYEVVFWQEGTSPENTFSLTGSEMTCDSTKYTINLNADRTPSGSWFRWDVVIVQPPPYYQKITQPNIKRSRTVMGKGRSGGGNSGGGQGGSQTGP